MSDETTAILTDAEILAAVDSRFDIITEDICRSGYGLSWEREQKRPTLDMLARLREMRSLLAELESRWTEATR